MVPFPFYFLLFFQFLFEISKQEEKNMMKLIIKNYETGDVLLQTKGRFESLFDILPLLNAAQLEKDFLGVGFPCPIINTGICSFSTTENYMESGEPISGVSILKGNETTKTDIRIKAVAYPEGYVIGSGRTATNLLGCTKKMYLKSIGRKNVRSTGIADCHVFPNINQLQKYVEKHMDVFDQLIDQGWYPKAEYCCDFFHEDLIKAGKEVSLDAVNAIFRDMIQSHQNPIPDSDRVTDEEIQMEKAHRMKSLGLHDSGIITMSDSPNFMLKLSEPAKEAIRQAKEYGVLPYHVIATHFATIGDVYSVLYVSENPGDWAYERKSPDGRLFAYCYNATYPECSEFGSIQIQMQDKGLARIS